MKNQPAADLQNMLNLLDARITKIEEYLKSFNNYSPEDDMDILLDDAEKLAREHDMVSASLFQRRLEIGYARASRILDQLEQKGVVGKGEGSKPRKVIKEI